MVAQVVTGYVPIANHPRTAQEYGKLGEQIFIPLVQAGVNVKRYMEPLEMTWLHKYVSRFKNPPKPMVADNPAKNTLAYHCVQHQKFAWLLKAAIEDPRPDVFVWLDYGIGHVPGVTPVVIGDYLDYVIKNPTELSIPGCWPTTNYQNFDWQTPCWRFCGGVLAVPRQCVHKLHKAVKTAALAHIDHAKTVEWEVNTLARAEIKGLLPPKTRWYQADHNETMFTGVSNGLASGGGGSGPAPVAPAASGGGA